MDKLKDQQKHLFGNIKQEMYSSVALLVLFMYIASLCLSHTTLKRGSEPRLMDFLSARKQRPERLLLPDEGQKDEKSFQFKPLSCFLKTKESARRNS